MSMCIRLVVLTISKNISQLGWLFPYIMENKIHVWNHQPVYIYTLWLFNTAMENPL